jgi:hypothetical protein
MMTESKTEASFVVMPIGESLTVLKVLYDPDEERPDLHSFTAERDSGSEDHARWFPGAASRSA